MNLRELSGRALVATDLTMRSHVEGHVDRIVALAGADPLGASLLRVKYAQDRTERPRAIALLAKRLQGKARAQRWRHAAPVDSGGRIVVRLAGLVLTEWTHDTCGTCMGRKWVSRATRPDGTVSRDAQRVSCRACNGTGAAPAPAPSQRALALGLTMQTWSPQWEQRVERGLDVARTYDAMAVRALRKRLDSVGW